MGKTMSQKELISLFGKTISRRALLQFLGVLMIVTFLTSSLLSASAAAATNLPPAGRTYEAYPSLKEVYKDYFTMGIFGSGEINALIYNFAAYSPGNEMKPESTQTVKGTFTYNSVNNAFDNLTNRNPNMIFYGHTLAWHSQTPTWMWDAPPAMYGQPGTFDRATALDNLNNHIDNVLGNFGGRLKGIDVVNEAVGTPNPNDWKASLTKGEGWYMALGWEWVELAFLEAAKVVDSHGWDCKLIYNDFGLDSPNKAHVVYEMVKSINERYAGVRPNGKPLIEIIGMQEHDNFTTSAANVENTIKLFSTLPGVRINITEMDVGCPPIGVLTPENENNQAMKFAELFQIFKKYAAGPANMTNNPKVIDRVSICGVRDATSGWRAGEFALLFTSNGLAKQAFVAVLDPDAFLETHQYIDPGTNPEVKPIDGVYVYNAGKGDAWSGANIILGNDASKWPWSTADADGKVAFSPEKDATYRLSFNYTATGTTSIRVRWVKDNSNNAYTTADGAVVNKYPYSANQVATTIPAYFNRDMVNMGSYTLTTEIKLDGSQPVDGLIGNIAIRGGGGGSAYTINWIKVEKVGTGGVSDKLLVNWPEGIQKSDDELADIAVRAIQEGTYTIPYTVRMNQDTRNAWVQSAVNALIPAGNGATAKVTYDNGYVVSVLKGTVTKLAMITVTEDNPVSALNVTTTANLVKKGDYFDVTVSLPETTTANAVSLVLNYDKDKFEYAGNLGADPLQASYIDGVTYLTSDAGDGNIKLTMMIPDYKTKYLVSLRFRARENADIQNADNSITATANLVYKTSEGSKFVFPVSGSTDFTTSGNPGDTDADGKVTLLDLSNVIDMFGVKNGDVLWAKAKFFDFNKNKAIDIADIVAVAKLIF